MAGVRRIVGLAAVALLLCASGAGVSRAAATPARICDAAADFALDGEDYPAAIKLHRAILQAQPDNALAHYHLGFAYAMSGQRAAEVSEYLTALRLGLRQWDLFLNLGLAYLDQHQLTLAADAFASAEALAPHRPEPHFNLALVDESQGRLHEALREITLARRLAPADPDAANANAIICIELGDVAGARQIWTLLSQAAPQYQPARTNLSLLNGSSVHDGFSFASGSSSANSKGE